MFYADITLRTGASVPFDADYDERAIYTVSGEIEISGDVFGPAQLLVFRPGDRITVRERTDARLHDTGWRAHGWASVHLVELRVLAEGSHRASEGRLEGRTV